MPTDRVPFLGVRFDPLNVGQVLERIRRVTHSSPYGYLVTPNVDHLVRLHDADAPAGLAQLYRDASLCLCDSRILHRLAALHGLRLPVVPGSDLTAIILDQIVEKGDRVAVVGGDAEMMADLRQSHPGLVWLHHQPPMGLRRNEAARRDAANFIAQSGCRFAFIAVGSPQQEMIAAEAGKIAGATGLALCIGASLDFITGREQRAPKLLQRMSLEWAYRLVADPRRMWRRYLVEGPRIFLLAARFRRGDPTR